MTLGLNAFLGRLEKNIFYQPYASPGKDSEGLFVHAQKMPKNKALEMAVLQINGPRRIQYLTFDIDRNFGGLAWDDNNIPSPNIIIINPQNGHAHLIYELAQPVWLDKKSDTHQSESPPVKYMKAIQKAMARELKADISYNHLMTKNPFYKGWRSVYMTDHLYTLGELANHLDLSYTIPQSAEIKDTEVSGRRAILFESIRHWAYKSKGYYNCESDFYNAILDELHIINDSFIKGPEKFSELRSIAKSVSRWVWKNYTIRQKREGIMNLPPDEPLRLKQQKGQAFSANVKREKTLKKLTTAAKILLDKQEPISPSILSKHTGISLNTVKTYWQNIGKLTSDSQHTPTYHIKSSYTKNNIILHDSKNFFEDNLENFFTNSLTLSSKEDAVGFPDNDLTDTRIVHTPIEISRKTSMTRTKKSISLIETAIKVLEGDNNRITRTAVAKKSRLHRNTVGRLWSVVRNNGCDMALKSHIPPERASSEPLAMVNVEKPASYMEILNSTTDEKFASVKAYVYANKYARKGILIDGLPDSLLEKMKNIVERVLRN